MPPGEVTLNDRFCEDEEILEALQFLDIEQARRQRWRTFRQDPRSGCADASRFSAAELEHGLKDVLMAHQECRCFRESDTEDGLEAVVGGQEFGLRYADA